MEKLRIGTRVSHFRDGLDGHGLGTIVGYNPAPAWPDSFYGSDRYPYVVRFDSSYEDVYGPGEFDVLPLIEQPLYAVNVNELVCE